MNSPHAVKKRKKRVYSKLHHHHNEAKVDHQHFMEEDFNESDVIVFDEQYSGKLIHDYTVFKTTFQTTADNWEIDFGLVRAEFRFWTNVKGLYLYISQRTPYPSSSNHQVSADANTSIVINSYGDFYIAVVDTQFETRHKDQETNKEDSTESDTTEVDIPFTLTAKFVNDVSDDKDDDQDGTFTGEHHKRREDSSTSKKTSKEILNLTEKESIFVLKQHTACIFFLVRLQNQNSSIVLDGPSHFKLFVGTKPYPHPTCKYTQSCETAESIKKITLDEPGTYFVTVFDPTATKEKSNPSSPRMQPTSINEFVIAIEGEDTLMSSAKSSHNSEHSNKVNQSFYSTLITPPASPRKRRGSDSDTRKLSNNDSPSGTPPRKNSLLGVSDGYDEIRNRSKDSSSQPSVLDFYLPVSIQYPTEESDNNNHKKPTSRDSSPRRPSRDKKRLSVSKGRKTSK
eukprot:TRINITY_DN8894_c0_g1_i1.p1 TRINITY_DN8894_c0_g1~~TRINITY_DN8894_c0_g1_i1.p1  ORF type:complete len:454 (+),score=77.68 TRINITY_DN8894_c0_g1_i1:13-1374(+)